MYKLFLRLKLYIYYPFVAMAMSGVGVGVGGTFIIHLWCYKKQQWNEFNMDGRKEQISNRFEVLNLHNVLYPI
jgi:hypothetical protein